MALLQDAPSLPRDTPTPRFVRIRHPDYNDAENTLLCMRGFDDGGLDYDTTLAACSIVTGNTSTGFFTTLEQRLERVARPDDGVLRGTDYFFQLPDIDTASRPYPIIPRFEDWSFPHGALPSPWNEYNKAIHEATTACRITDATWGVQKAHVVPDQVSAWWDREQLDQYVLTERFTQRPIDAAANLMPMRSDLHTVFDAKAFAIVPKRDSRSTDTARGDLSLVVHIINPIPDPYFQQTFHNRKVLPLRCSIQCLFARFAWTVFSPNVMSQFLTRCITRRKLLVRDPETGALTVEERNISQLRDLLETSRSRSASPRKRKVPGEADSDVSITEYDTPFSDVSGNSQGDSEWPTEASTSRGRSRKRRWASDQDAQDGLVQKRARAGLDVFEM